MQIYWHNGYVDFILGSLIFHTWRTFQFEKINDFCALDISVGKKLMIFGHLTFQLEKINDFCALDILVGKKLMIFGHFTFQLEKINDVWALEISVGKI